MYTASGGFRFALSSQLPQGEGEEMDAAAAGSLSQVPADAELSAFEGKSKKSDIDLSLNNAPAVQCHRHENGRDSGRREATPKPSMNEIIRKVSELKEKDMVTMK